MPIWTSVATGGGYQGGVLLPTWAQTGLARTEQGGSTALQGMLEAIAEMSIVLLGNKCLMHKEK